MKTISGIGIGKKYEVEGKPLQKARKALYRLGYLGKPEKGKRTYPVFKELPESQAELWAEYRKQFYTNDLRSTIEDAHSEIEELACEMEEWSSNLEDGGLGDTYVAEQALDCSEMLQDQASMLGDLTVPDSLADLNVMTVIPYDVSLLSGRSRNIGRGKRLANALAALETAIAAPTSEMLENQEIGEWVGGLQEILDELGNIDFPGAYG